MSANDETVIVNMEVEENTSTISALDKAYMELGKAYYEGRYEKPTPELIYYFDQIKTLLNEEDTDSVDESSSENTHILEMEEEQESKLEDLPVLPIQPMEMPKSQEVKPSFCPKCGTKHGPDDKFCGNCGALLK